ncbi:gas vesicle protein GvpO [Nonomuraea sp. NPDC049709]|uniref:gas vesicle protein GvpO n=1 Tax=Nonomuraea sp. NPDC049709 TaxID=3154736 RepID=UPI003432DF94
MTIRRPTAEKTTTTRRPAAEKTTTARRATAEKPRTQAPRPPAPEPQLTAVTAGGVGMRHIEDLTTKRAEGITSVQRTEGGWLINVEVVEDRRIPSSGDMLAVYQAEIDGEGSLLSYRRIRRYRRSNADYGEAV